MDTGRWYGDKRADRMRAWWLGFREGTGSCGVTWEESEEREGFHEENWRLNESYDSGRYLRQSLPL